MVKNSHKSDNFYDLKKSVHISLNNQQEMREISSRLDENWLTYAASIKFKGSLAVILYSRHFGEKTL